MPQYEKWLTDNAVIYLRYVLKIQYPEMVVEPAYETNFDDDEWPKLTIKGKYKTMVSILSCNLSLTDNPQEIEMDAIALKDSDINTFIHYKFIIIGPSFDSLLKATYRYACYSLNEPLQRNCRNDALRHWVESYEVNERNEITCQLMCMQKPKPKQPETQDHKEARINLIKVGIISVWKLITGIDYKKGIAKYNNCQLSGSLELRSEEGIGLYLIYKSFSLLVLQPDIATRLNSPNPQSTDVFKILAQPAGIPSAGHIVASEPAALEKPKAPSAASSNRKRTAPAEDEDIERPRVVQIQGPEKVLHPPKFKAVAPLPTQASTPVKKAAPFLPLAKAPAQKAAPSLPLAKAPAQKAAPSLPLAKASAHKAVPSLPAKTPALFNLPSTEFKELVDTELAGLRAEVERNRKERADPSTLFNMPGSGKKH